VTEDRAASRGKREPIAVIGWEIVVAGWLARRRFRVIRTGMEHE